jgi:hypothetical protein
MSEYSRWVAEHEVKHTAEIERLNAQVAMYREGILDLMEWHAKNIRSWPNPAYD